MLVKKFEAPSLEKALMMVKTELGPQALVLSTQKKQKNWFRAGSIEVTAAFQAQIEPPVDRFEKEFSENSLAEIFPHRKKQNKTVDDSVKKTESRYIEIDSAIRHPKTTIKPIDYSRFERDFMKRGFSQDTARDFSQRIVMDYPARELSDPNFLFKAQKRLMTKRLITLSSDIFESKNSWVAVGPPGSGKTTFLVKLALFLKNKNKNVHLVSLDSKKMVGRAELASYARVLGIPFSAELPKMSTNENIQLIDSPALQGDSFTKWIEMCRDRSTILVLDGSLRLNEMFYWIDKMEELKPVGVVFSKMELVRQPGVLFDVLKEKSLPLLGISESSQFKGALRFFDSNSLSDFLIRGA